jgi:hypothetical protein
LRQFSDFECNLQLGIGLDIDKWKEDVIGSQIHVFFDERARGDILENETTRRPR